MALWTCSCGALNTSKARHCEACGKARSEGVRTQPQQPTPSADDLRCSWLDHGRRCYMTGTIGTKSTRCTWHSFTANRPQLVEVYDEFERWVLGMLEAKYCCEWTHDRPHELWRAVRGEAPLPPYPSACYRASCAHASEVGTGRTEALRAVQQELAAVEPGAPGV